MMLPVKVQRVKIAQWHLKAVSQDLPQLSTTEIGLDMCGVQWVNCVCLCYFFPNNHNEIGDGLMVKDERAMEYNHRITSIEMLS